MKRHFNQKIILKLEMAVLVTIALVAVTIAWFTMNHSADVTTLFLQAHDDKYIKVALKSGGEDVSLLKDKERYVDIHMPAFYDIKEGMMAPGVYGKITLYITALNPMAKKCSIDVERVPEFISSVSSNNQKEIEKLLTGHLLFYSEYTETEGYKNLITEDTPLEVELRENVEVPVTIYWMWPYEYTDIPMEDRMLGSDAFFDMDKYKEENESIYTNEDYISFYDYGDTKIGLSVEDIHFYVYVNTLEKN